MTPEQRIMEMDRLLCQIRKLVDEVDSHRWQMAQQILGQRAQIDTLKEQVEELETERDDLCEQVYDS